jgi:hypothetical protein
MNRLISVTDAHSGFGLCLTHKSVENIWTLRFNSTLANRIGTV